MINPGPARALGELAARAQEMLSAYQPGYETSYNDLRSTTLARPQPAVDPLNVSGPEGAYFLGLDQTGKSFYSRDGSFALTSGALTFPDGSAVLGYPAGGAANPGPQPLRINPVDAALGRADDAHVEADGTVAYSRAVVDPKTGKAAKERVVAGRIALARFPAGTQMQRLTPTHVAAPAGIAASVGKPSDGTFGALATQSRDLGSIDFEAGLDQLREAFLALDAMSASGQAEANESKAALDLIK